MTPSTCDQDLSYGRYLQRCRQERGLRIENVSRELKLTVELLTAIENEEYAKFPDAVFARGFLKAFAGVVGADSDRVLQSYATQISSSRESIAAEAAIGNENHLFWKKLLASSAVLVLLISLTLLMMPDTEERRSAETAPLPENALQTAGETQGNMEEAALRQEVAAEASPLPTAHAGKMLEIVTIEETWIKIIIDNEKSKEYTLRPGDRLALEARERFNLLIGNSAGIQLFLDKTPVAFHGEKGQVANIEIP